MIKICQPLRHTRVILPFATAFLGLGCASAPIGEPSFLGVSAGSADLFTMAYELLLVDGRFPCLNIESIEMVISQEVVETDGELRGADRWTVHGCDSTNFVDVTYTSDKDGNVHIDIDH
jgi:hypothetical protein